MYRIFSLSLLLIYSLLPATGQGMTYRVFDNITLSADASVINCFSQDRTGLIWIGTNRGLYSYDGFSAQAHVTEIANTQVYCISIIDEDILYIGTDNGVFIYNYKKDRYENSIVNFPADVRTMYLDKGILWIGSLNGLFRYDISKNKLESIASEQSNIPHKTIYSIIGSQGNMYIGTYNGLCRYIPIKNRFEKIPLPLDSKRSNQFVNILLEDNALGCIWIGMEGNLLKYIPSSQKVEFVGSFSNNSVKSLALDRSNNLLVGTDNGLYVYNKQSGITQHVDHDSRNSNSLVNNVMWSIFTDREGNVWFGTDYNISLSRANEIFRIIPISHITGVGDGNRFHTLYRDSRMNYWLGGTNGLILSSTLNGSSSSIWYRMDDSRYPISHNRVRYIYEDRENNIWIATDGSISLYDYKEKQFRQFSIVDRTHTYNSNWAYYLFEDNVGNLWIATCLGGIFVVNKKSLMETSGTYVAEYNYTTKDGLSGMFINQVIPDKNEDVWVLTYRNGIDKIDAKTRKISKVEIGCEMQNEVPNFILRDSEDYMWVGFSSELVRINTDNGKSDLIKFNEFGNSDILSMIEEGQRIWLTTMEGVWSVNKLTFEVQRMNISSKSFTTGFFDKLSDQIYFGSSDELALLTPATLSRTEPPAPIILTNLYINDKLYNPGPNQNSIRYTKRLYLNYKQNNLVFEFSDLIYSQKENNKFVYKLENFEENWNVLKPNTNRVSYSNLEYGEYKLLIGKLDSNGRPSESCASFILSISPPWYYTMWVKIVYMLLFIGLIIWIINFIRVKNNLRFERLEKEKMLELSALKMDFFTNVSHEFKTPLSLILAPVSRLIHGTKDPQKRKQLEMIQSNALKLNSLIRQIIDFNRNQTISSDLILSKVEFVEFARSLFSVFEDGFKEKDITFTFTSNMDKIYIDIDIQKMESMLNNLISNACKYTEQGCVGLNINYSSINKKIEINLIDTGIGIPDSEIPYVFERFYKSSKTKNNKEGTGIGLHLVKTYVEQHRGEIDIVSEENEGTRITVTLPIDENAIFEKEVESKITEGNRLKILIVEDNTEIADFIYHTLEERYECEVCHNGKQGFETCQQFLPDLVVADVMMPIMDGLEMARLIRKHIPISTIPIILLTAKDDKLTEKESISLKVDVFMPKPFDPEILLLRIDQLLNSKQQFEDKFRIESLTFPKPIEAVSLDEKLLSQINEIIEDKIADSDLNVNLLSTISGISSKHIYRKLKQLTGMSPVEYIRFVRIQKASMLLCQNKFSISEVMYMVGFSNHSYFSKCFQSEFGKTPRQFVEDLK